MDEFLQQIKNWVVTSRDRVIPVNHQNYDLCTDDHIKLLERFKNKPDNVSIIYSTLQDAVYRYQSEAELAHVPPLFFKIPNESWGSYLDRCYASNHIPF